MDEKFTPGPWVANGDKIETANGTCRARVAIIDDGAGVDCQDANADLIAAAPDLYAALKCLYDKLLMSDRDGQSHISEEEGEMALGALRKAGGEA